MENCFKGAFADVWHILSAKMNFTYTIRKTSEWGALLPNGSWTGMIGTRAVRPDINNIMRI